MTKYYIERQNNLGFCVNSIEEIEEFCRKELKNKDVPIKIISIQKRTVEDVQFPDIVNKWNDLCNKQEPFIPF